MDTYQLLDRYRNRFQEYHLIGEPLRESVREYLDNLLRWEIDYDEPLFYLLEQDELFTMDEAEFLISELL